MCQIANYSDMQSSSCSSMKISFHFPGQGHIMMMTPICPSQTTDSARAQHSRDESRYDHRVRVRLRLRLRLRTIAARPGRWLKLPAARGRTTSSRLHKLEARSALPPTPRPFKNYSSRPAPRLPVVGQLSHHDEDLGNLDRHRDGPGDEASS
jgi:hypothetical protein